MTGIRTMLRRAQLFIVESILLGVEMAVALTMVITRYSIDVWRNNAARRWVLDLLNKIAQLFSWLKRYLQHLETNIQYRMLYENLTGPMKIHYRRLKRRHP